MNQQDKEYVNHWLSENILVEDELCNLNYCYLPPLRLAVCCYWHQPKHQSVNCFLQCWNNYCVKNDAYTFHATYAYAVYALVVCRLIKYAGEQDWKAVKPLLDDWLLNPDSLVQEIKSHYSDFLLGQNAAKKRHLMPDVQAFAEKHTDIFPCYEWIEGKVPLIMSMPHNGTCLPGTVAKGMTEVALELRDTDWFLRLLYDFCCDMNIYLICPVFSRYVIDLNRPADNYSLYPGADTTTLCPTTTFARESLYLENKEPDSQTQQKRIENYWYPYHQKLSNSLSEIQEQYGQVLLFEAHSIASRVPRFFDGELPDFNFGTYDGKSCRSSLQSLIQQMDVGPFSKVVNGRFKGGYITRQYGKPSQNQSTLQLELSQKNYMDENNFKYIKELSDELQVVLKRMMSQLIDWLNLP